MKSVVMIGLVDPQGRLLLQERDEHAPVEPNKWCLVGGGVEGDEGSAAAAQRELAEETGLVRDDLRLLGRHDLPCAFHGRDIIDLFAASTTATDADIVCGEGRQIIFVEPSAIPSLDLTDTSRALFPLVLEAHAGSANPGSPHG